MDRSIEFYQISCFVAAAEELHFGRAASRLNVTQPTLSRQIQTLEDVLKVRLFDRINRSVRLTSAGQVFLPEAKRMLAQAESAVKWTRRQWRGETGVIRLGFTATAAFSDLPVILAAAAPDMPDAKILLKEGTSTFQKDQLLAQMLDVALLRPPIARSQFERLSVRHERFVAAVHVNDPLAARPGLTLQDFDGAPFIMYSADGASYSHAMLTSMFEKAQVVPDISHYLDQNHSMLMLVSAGMGSALVPASYARLSLPGVVFKDVETTPPEPIEMCLIWRRENVSPVLARFLDLCRRIYSSGCST